MKLIADRPDIITWACKYILLQIGIESGFTRYLATANVPGPVKQSVYVILVITSYSIHYTKLYELQDAQLSLRRIADSYSLVSERVFIEPYVVSAAASAGRGP